jgi:hypothetical protein
MRKNLLLVLAGVFFASALSAQENKVNENEVKVDGKELLIPYVGFSAGGCGVSNPFAFMVGVQQPLKTHFSIAYDINFWKTNYETYCCDVYSKGKYTSVTPSVKFFYNTGRQTGKGFFAGLGLGYMIAKDRGIERSYSVDPMTGTTEFGKDIIEGNWDFHSIAPSVTLGVGLRVWNLPVGITNTYYFAKTPWGFQAAEGGVGLKIGFKKLEKGK